MGDGVVRAGVGAHAALLTLVGIDVGPALAHGDGAELTGVLTGLSHTFAAVVGHGVGGDGTLLAGRADDLDHVSRILAAGGA